MPEERERFVALNDDVFALYGEGRLAEALETVEASEPLLPRWRSRTLYWRACLLAQLGRPEEALATLKDGLADGLWWRPDWLTTDHDLERLWDLPGFDEVVMESEHRQVKANAAQPDRPHMLVLPPTGQPRGALVALHMYGATPEESAPWWRAATELGLVVCLPRSTRVQAEGHPCWDDDMAAARDVAVAVETAMSAHPVPGGSLILAGASQGGVRAIEMALLGEPPAGAFIGIVAGVADPDLLEGHVDEAVARGLRGWLLTGERDAARQAVELLHHQLTEAGMECRLDVVPGLGHAFPEDFPQRLRAALRSLLGT